MMAKSAKLKVVKSIGKIRCFNILTTGNPERKGRKKIPLKIVSKRIKYLGINLPKEVKYVWFLKTTRTLMT